MERRLKLLSLHLMVTLVIVEGNKMEFTYVFVEKTVDYIKLAPPKNYFEEEYQEDHFTHLNSRERMNLCFSAYSYATLPFINDEYVFRAEVYQFALPDDDDDIDAVVKCPTLPPIYLRCEDTKKRKEIRTWIMFDGSFANGFSFDVEVVQKVNSISPLESANYQLLGSGWTWDEEMQNNRLAIVEPEDRWNLCFVARRRLHLRIKFLSQAGVEKSRIYNSDPRSGFAYVAVDCRTAPRMYLRLKSATDHDNPTIKIVFVESDLIPSEDL